MDLFLMLGNAMGHEQGLAGVKVGAAKPYPKTTSFLDYDSCSPEWV